jgi:hypothetical protein
MNLNGYVATSEKTVLDDVRHGTLLATGSSTQIKLDSASALGAANLGVRRSVSRLVARKGKGKKGKSTSGINLPPELDASVISGHIFRFTNTSTVVSASITIGNLIGICGVVGTITNSTVASIASSIKVRHIDIWPGESTGNHAPEISWAGGSYSTVPDKSKMRSLPEGITMTGRARYSPGKDSLARLWQNSASTSSVVFIMYDIPAGSVVDVHLTYTQRNTQAGVSYAGFTTVVLGTMYYMHLDGRSTAAFLPMGLPSTT